MIPYPKVEWAADMTKVADLLNEANGLLSNVYMKSLPVERKRMDWYPSIYDSSDCLSNLTQALIDLANKVQDEVDNEAAS